MPSSVSKLAVRHSYVLRQSCWQCTLPLANFSTVSHPSVAFRAAIYSSMSGHSPHSGSKLSPAAMETLACVQLVSGPEQATLQSSLRTRNSGTFAHLNKGVNAPRPRSPSSDATLGHWHSSTGTSSMMGGLSQLWLSISPEILTLLSHCNSSG